MTRVLGYDLAACPACGQLHSRSRYSSVSVYLPQGLHGDDLRSCARCCEQLPLDAFETVGFIDKSQMIPPSWGRRLLLSLRHLGNRESRNDLNRPWKLPHLR